MSRMLNRSVLAVGVLAGAVTAATASCGDDDTNAVTPGTDAGNGGIDATAVVDAGADVTTTPPLTFGKRPSKSGTIAISEDDAIVGMINPEDGSVSFFKTADNTRISAFKTGKEPSSIVIAADNKTAFVANRGDATVVRITGIDTPVPQIANTVAVGSEPTGIALSPGGSKLFVAEFAESTVGVIDVATFKRTTMGSVRNPRAVLVTNNGDTNEADETVVVTEFYGSPVAGKEAQNDGRVGHVRLFGTDGAAKGGIDFNPFTNTEPSFEAKTSPNQLFSVAVAGSQVFVTSISSSPALPLGFDKNLYAVVYVGDLTGKTEVTGPLGSANLTQLVQALPAGPKLFLGDTVDIDFVPGTKIAYTVSRAADVIERIDYGGAAVAIGAAQAKQIDVQGAPSASDVKACHNPSGIAIAGKLQKAYVNCWGSHRMAVLDLTSQNVAAVVESTAPATTAIDKGRHFFFTGRGRWSGNGNGTTAPTANGQAWSSCGSCHPDGYSDNMTWVFAAGPRQSTSVDGSFSHGPGTQKQRLFNWTGIIDEMHDFEANTRGVSGGLGAVTNAPATGDCGDLAKETRRGTDVAGALPGALAGPAVKEIADGTKGLTTGAHCLKTDWDDINEYAKTIRPPLGKRFADAAAIARGLEVFKTTARCDKCHGGAGWTVSRRGFTPSEVTNTALATTVFPNPAAPVPAEFVAGDVASKNTTWIQLQQPGAEADPDNVAQRPAQLSCVIRNVGTFGVRQATGALDAAATLPLEARSGAPTRAQGFRGYNVPSLYGMTLGGPFLHHGQAATLEELFSTSTFGSHWKAGNPNFDPAKETNRADLVAFIESIDATTAEVTLPSGFDLCPN